MDVISARPNTKMSSSNNRYETATFLILIGMKEPSRILDSNKFDRIFIEIVNRNGDSGHPYHRLLKDWK